MPTYEYACKTCGEHLEVVQSFKDSPLTECPACGGQLRKVFGNIGITFKGSGFYKTDSRSDGRKSSHKSSTESSGAGSGSTAGSSTSTGSGTSSSPAPKSEAKSAGSGAVAAAS
jgi:putative FmdB family regulatory protein